MDLRNGVGQRVRAHVPVSRPRGRRASRELQVVSGPVRRGSRQLHVYTRPERRAFARVHGARGPKRRALDGVRVARQQDLRIGWGVAVLNGLVVASALVAAVRESSRLAATAKAALRRCCNSPTGRETRCPEDFEAGNRREDRCGEDFRSAIGANINSERVFNRQQARKSIFGLWSGRHWVQKSVFSRGATRQKALKPVSARVQVGNGPRDRFWGDVQVFTHPIINFFLSCRSAPGNGDENSVTVRQARERRQGQKSYHGRFRTARGLAAATAAALQRQVPAPPSRQGWPRGPGGCPDRRLSAAGVN